MTLACRSLRKGMVNIMADLLKCREEIDKIDKQIVKLIEHRMKIAEEVAEYKRNSGKQVLDKEREQQKIEAVKALAGNTFNKQGIQELFKQIMSMSRKLQYSMLNEDNSEFTSCRELPRDKDTKVVFFGVKGSYTEQAMEEYFGKEIDSFPASTFREVMSKVKEGNAEYGVLPIENTTTGGITDCYDLLIEFDNYIVAEHVIKVDQALMGLPGSDISTIKKVYSHPQGILQSRGYLSKYPDITAIETESTAYAAKKVLEDNDKTQAAVAGIRAAKAYGLTVLAENINDEEGNSTRFIIITNKKIYLENSDKVSICFSIPHKSGTLYNILSHINYNDLSMTKIESRPLQGKKFEYRFFIDYEGNFKDASVRNTLSGIRSEALELKILGNYTT